MESTAKLIRLGVRVCAFLFGALCVKSFVFFPAQERLTEDQQAGKKVGLGAQ